MPPKHSGQIPYRGSFVDSGFLTAHRFFAASDAISLRRFFVKPLALILCDPSLPFLSLLMAASRPLRVPFAVIINLSSKHRWKIVLDTVLSCKHNAYRQASERKTYDSYIYSLRFDGSCQQPQERWTCD